MILLPKYKYIERLARINKDIENFTNQLNKATRETQKKLCKSALVSLYRRRDKNFNRLMLCD